MCQHGLRGAWGANAGVESTNGAIHDVGMGIDSLGGAVDGARGKVGTRSTSEGCTCCGCAALPSLNMKRESAVSF